MNEHSRVYGWKARTATGVACHYCGTECEVATGPASYIGLPYFVQCLLLTCGATGPLAKTRKAAIEAHRLLKGAAS